MKKIIFLAGGLFYSAMTFAQDIRANEVPSVVLNTFKQKFPKAADVEWELKDQLYNVEFEVDRVDYEAWINSTGSIVKHKKDIRENELPKSVSATISKNYKGYKVDDAERIGTGGKFLYKVELKTASKEENVVFDQDGKLVENY